MAPEEVHQLGLDRSRMLQAQMDAILRKQGLTSGSVGERMTALGKDPSAALPEHRCGARADTRLSERRVADIRTRLPRAFATLVRGG